MVFELKKCSCGSSWCKACFKRRGLKKIKERLRGWDYRNVRHIVLTVDRDIKAKEKFQEVVEGKKIHNFIRNLQRGFGRKVIDWLWLIEFHEDGYPHWHLLVLTEKKEMIGGDRIRTYWLSGSWIRESYFKNEKHWKAVTGYLEKNGYFESEKDHQGKLPEWALKEEGVRIRRYGGMVKNKGKGEGEMKKRKRIKLMERKKEKNRNERTYEVILESCGQETRIYIHEGFMGFGFTSKIPYIELISHFSGRVEFIEGIGATVRATDEDLNTLVGMEEEWEIRSFIRKSFHDEVNEAKLIQYGKGGDRDERYIIGGDQAGQRV